MERPQKFHPLIANRLHSSDTDIMNARNGKNNQWPINYTTRLPQTVTQLPCAINSVKYDEQNMMIIDMEYNLSYTVRRVSQSTYLRDCTTNLTESYRIMSEQPTMMPATAVYNCKKRRVISVIAVSAPYLALTNSRPPRTQTAPRYNGCSRRIEECLYWQKSGTR